MNSLIAKTDRELGLCLRMLYSVGIKDGFTAEARMNDKHKIEFLIQVPLEGEEFEKVKMSFATICGRS